MKEAYLPSPSLEGEAPKGLLLDKLSFLGNGPYDLAISPGECVGITGRSGVGKTQLLRAVADVIGHGGDCFLEGRSSLTIPAPDWRKMVALVPAESYWWYDTVGGHFGEELQLASFRDLLLRLGFTEDVMGWQVSRLSTGERQRLALIRTLVNSPRVLLLDEPTSALDKEMEAVVEDIVASICAEQQTVCLWVSHDQEQLSRVAGRVFLLEQSGLLERGER